MVYMAPEMIMMLARECHWTIDHILAMPIRRFFAAYREVVRLRAIDLVNACDIAVIPNCDVEKYYKSLRNWYLRPLKKARPSPVPRDESSALTGARAQAAMQALFRMKKRFS